MSSDTEADLDAEDAFRDMWGRIDEDDSLW